MEYGGWWKGNEGASMKPHSSFRRGVLGPGRRTETTSHQLPACIRPAPGAALVEEAEQARQAVPLEKETRAKGIERAVNACDHCDERVDVATVQAIGVVACLEEYAAGSHTGIHQIL